MAQSRLTAVLRQQRREERARDHAAMRRALFLEQQEDKARRQRDAAARLKESRADRLIPRPARPGRRVRDERIGRRATAQGVSIARAALPAVDKRRQKPRPPLAPKARKTAALRAPFPRSGGARPALSAIARPLAPWRVRVPPSNTVALKHDTRSRQQISRPPANNPLRRPGQDNRPAWSVQSPRSAKLNRLIQAARPRARTAMPAVFASPPPRLAHRPGASITRALPPARPLPERRRAASLVRPPLTAMRDPLLARIPAGLLSATLPWLRVAANRLYTVAGAPIVLRGVSLSLPGDNDLPAIDCLAALLNWGVNVVRLRLDTGQTDYEVLDELIALSAARGAYTVLAAGRTPLAGASVPWRRLARRYADEPAVLFELDSAKPAPHPLYLRSMLAHLRAEHPAAVCLAPCTPEAADDALTAIDGEPLANLLYTLHLRQNAAPLTGLAELARRWPLFVTGWDAEAQSERVAQLLTGLNIHWTANTVDGGLLRETRGVVAPTSAGHGLRRALALGAAFAGGVQTTIAHHY